MTPLPPAGFVSAAGLRTAAPCEPPIAGTAISPKPAQQRHQRGLRYETAVRSAVQEWADSRKVEMRCGPWFKWTAAESPKWRFCQPDLLVDSGPRSPLLVLEVKLSIEARAWWQLDSLYQPVVERALRRPVRTAAITQSFDPAIRGRVPVAVALCLGDLAAWLDQLTAESTLSLPPEPETLAPLLRVLQWRK